MPIDIQLSEVSPERVTFTLTNATQEDADMLATFFCTGLDRLQELIIEESGEVSD